VRLSHRDERASTDHTCPPLPSAARGVSEEAPPLSAAFGCDAVNVNIRLVAVGAGDFRGVVPQKADRCPRGKLSTRNLLALEHPAPAGAAASCHRAHRASTSPLPGRRSKRSAPSGKWVCRSPTRLRGSRRRPRLTVILVRREPSAGCRDAEVGNRSTEKPEGFAFSADRLGPIAIRALLGKAWHG
jgi:hypothetical protein